MRVGILRASSFPSSCNCRCGRNWSCCRRHARCLSPGLRRATASSLALFIHLAPWTPATVPDPLQPPQAFALQVITLSPATEGGPLSLTDFSLHVICALLSGARDPPLHTLTDEEETLRITLPPGGAGPLTRGCVL